MRGQGRPALAQSAQERQRQMKGVSAEMRGHSYKGMRDKGHLMTQADGLHLSCECLVGPLLHVLLAQDDGRGMRGGDPLKAR